MANKKDEAFVAYDATAWGSVTITKSDSTVLSPNLRALYVGGTGDVAVRMLDGSLPIFVGVPAGTTLLIQIDKVLSTGTSATSMIGLC